jgi:hypothetical protein
MNNIKKQVFFNISNVLDNKMNIIKINKLKIFYYVILLFLFYVFFFLPGTPEIFGYLTVYRPEKILNTD